MLTLLVAYLVLNILLPVRCTSYTIAYCSNTPGGEWRTKLTEMLTDVQFSTKQIDCQGVMQGGVAVALIDSTDNVVDLVEKSSNEGVETFADNILKKLASYHWTVIKRPEELQSFMSRNKESIVAYIGNTKSPEYISFCQAVLSNETPRKFSIAVIYQQKFLPSQERSYIGGDDTVVLWTVTNGWWSVWTLKKVSPFEVRDEIIRFMKLLNYPSILHYSGEDIDKVYENTSLHYLLIFHHTNQLQDILDSYVKELSSAYRGYYVFITIDRDKYPEKMQEYMLDLSTTELPFIILRKHGENKRGIRIQKEYIPYDSESLSHLLASIISPSVTNDDVPVRESVTVAYIDHNALPALMEERAPIVIVLCKTGSPDCSKIHKRMETAARASSVANPQDELQVFIIEVDSVQDVKQYEVDVNRLPCVLAKDDGKNFKPVDTEFNAFGLTKIVVKYSKPRTDTEEEEDDDTEDPSGKSFDTLDDYYNEFEELKEDETLFLMYPVLPQFFGHLTNENATQFMSQTENSLVVGFYLRYCISCRPMLVHLSQLSDTLQQSGVHVAVVDCGAYPDVCNIFNVSTFPSIKTKKESSTDWNEYKSIVSYNHLLAAITGQMVQQPTKREMTPDTMIELVSNGDIKSLLIYLSGELPQNKERLFSEVMDYKIYWLNSTKYSNAVVRFAGSKELPLLIWVDYEKRSVYHLEINDETKAADIQEFCNKIMQGLKPIDSQLDTATWTPFKPAIVFPSDGYLKLQGKSRSQLYQHDDSQLPSTDGMASSPPLPPHEIYPPPPDHHQHSEL